MTDAGEGRHAERLAERIERREARVAVVGLGYIGLPVTAAMVDAGFRVLGVDIDEAKIESLRRGEAYLHHLGDDLPSRLLASGRFEPSSDMRRLAEVDAVLVCVPTPLDPERRPDLGYVTRTMQALALVLHAGQLIVLESTTYPGTTRQIVLPLLTAGGLRCGHDVFLAYAPEREDPGRGQPTRTIPRLVGGVDDVSRDLAVRLYAAAIDRVVPVSSAEVAEAAKLLENIYRAVNIAMVNEMKMLLHAMHIDVHEVIDAAATKPFGFQAFRPGPGLGGHCLPIDPFYLAHVAREVGMPTRFIELAGEVSRAMPDYVVARTCEALARRGVDPGAARVLVLGVAYKPDVDDVRESPSFVIIERLMARGARVDYHDPHVPATHPVRHADVPPLESVSLGPGTLAGYDVVIVATDHAAVDYGRVAAEARLVIDTRGAMRGLPAKGEVVGA